MNCYCVLKRVKLSLALQLMATSDASDWPAETRQPIAIEFNWLAVNERAYQQRRFIRPGWAVGWGEGGKKRERGEREREKIRLLTYLTSHYPPLALFLPSRSLPLF